MTHYPSNLTSGCATGSAACDREAVLDGMCGVQITAFARADSAGEIHRKEMLVRKVLRARRRRYQFFSEELFADPAWDILLELYAAQLAQRRISVGAVCVGAAVPGTTALRWISALEKRGLVARHDDPYDGRRVYLRLTATGLCSMDGYFVEGC